MGFQAPPEVDDIKDIKEVLAEAKATTQDILARARLHALSKMPYFASSLGKLLPVMVPGLGTMGVTAKGQMPYDPAFTIWLEETHGIAAVAKAYLHEMLHWVCCHHGRRGDRDPKRYNIAGDIWINDTLRGCGFEKVDSWCYPEGFRDKAGTVFPPGLTAEQYYDLLDNADMSGWGGGDDGDGSDDLKDQDYGDGPTRTPEEQMAAGKRLANAIRSHAGDVPGGLDRWCDELLGKPKTPWPVTLGRSVRPCLEKAGRGRRTYRRISRLSTCMSGGGRPILMPSRTANKVIVWLVIDTSGSMSQDNVARGIVELQGLCDLPNVEVAVFSCDAEVSGPPVKVDNWRQAVTAIKGGGGTDFRPIAELYEQTPANEKPDLLACYTDGDGPAPASKPQGVHWMWLLSSDYGEPTIPAEWGDRVFLGDMGDR